MTAAKSNQTVVELRRSLDVAGKEVKLLHQTRERLFHGAELVDAGWVKRVAGDVELSERLVNALADLYPGSARRSAG